MGLRDARVGRKTVLRGAGAGGVCVCPVWGRGVKTRRDTKFNFRYSRQYNNNMLCIHCYYIWRRSSWYRIFYKNMYRWGESVRGAGETDKLRSVDGICHPAADYFFFFVLLYTHDIHTHDSGVRFVRVCVWNTAQFYVIKIIGRAARGRRRRRRCRGSDGGGSGGC